MTQSLAEELPVLGSHDDPGTSAVPQPPTTAKDDAEATFMSAVVPESVLRIPVAIQVIIGSARMPLSHVAQLGPGSVVTLDQKLGTPALILINGKEIAKGELFVLDGEEGGDRLGISITEIASPSRVSKP